MPMRPLLYVAGPYTRPDPVENTHKACKAATAIYEHSEWVPVVPHLSLLWHAITPQPLEFWYEYDLHVMRRCDAVVRLPGASSGADAEMAEARKVGLRIVNFVDLPWPAQAAWVG